MLVKWFRYFWSIAIASRFLNVSLQSIALSHHQGARLFEFEGRQSPIFHIKDAIGDV